MITRAAKYVDDDMVSGQMLFSCVKEHMGEVSRYERLKRYYEGRGDVKNRVRTQGLPNNRICHGFARFISTMASGYLAGKPVKYEARGAGAVVEDIIRHYEDCDMHSVDAELARLASVYGKACEIVYADERARPMSACLPASECFVVYDDGIRREPLFAVHIAARQKADGSDDGLRLDVYSKTRICRYEVENLDMIKYARPVGEAEHFFGSVPVIEYWNGDDERGDFEPVIDLIDAYDMLQSDRVNDKEQFVDALLVMTGCRLDIDEAGRSPGRQLREDKSISIPDGADIKWLYKSLSESDTEVLRRAINDDIHKMSMIPDLTDQNFAGNSSGVAMKYKLLGFEQLTRVKERWFCQGLRSRLRLYAGYMAVRGAMPADVEKVNIVFSRGLPVNELEQAQIIAQLRQINAIALDTAVERANPGWDDGRVESEVENILTTPGSNAEMFEQVLRMKETASGSKE
ncbi:MAG: phage portal protein [Clostridia bacterium]|nr:phage portal protein [Clostridia bacterium]